MKQSFSFLILAIVLAGCNRTPQAVSEEPQGASFKEGHGVKIPTEMQKSLGLEIQDVAEQKIHPRHEISLHVVRKSEALVEASGWITAAQAAVIKPGQKGSITRPDGTAISCEVVGVEKTADAALGEFEMVVHTAAALSAGTSVTATFETPATAEVVAVPAAAVMKTVEGEFVYAVNEEHFKRVPVQTGARSSEAVEITDGLYAGDQIVAAKVIPLWMTELQTLRAGQSCCKGH